MAKGFTYNSQVDVGQLQLNAVATQACSMTQQPCLTAYPGSCLFYLGVSPAMQL